MPANSRWDFQVVSFTRVSQAKPYMHLSLIRATCIALSFFFIWWVKLIKLLIIRYNLNKIILQSMADHNCDLRSTAVTEASNKPFQWRIAFHPNFTWPVVLHIFHYISLYFTCTKYFAGPYSWPPFSNLIFNISVRLLKNVHNKYIKSRNS